jgi:serine/threonine protein kinase
MDFHPRLVPVEIPESRAIKYLKELISAVDFLHSNSVTHNDIKPSNILLSDDDTIKLCDFGFAQRYPDNGQKEPHGDSKPALPRFHSQISYGTPEYLSPERAKATVHDERLSDIWSLGVTCYEIRVGRTPFEQDTTEEFLTKEALEVYYER